MGSPLGILTQAFGDSLSSNTPTFGQDIISLDAQQVASLLVQLPQAFAALAYYQQQLANAQSPMLSNRAMFSIPVLQANVDRAKANITDLDNQLKAALQRVIDDATALKAAL